MNLKERKGRKFIIQGDFLYAQILREYNRLKEEEKIASSEYCDNKKYALASQMGLAAECYLKGMLLPDLNVSISPNQKLRDSDITLLHQLIEMMTEEDKYGLLIDDDSVETELAEKLNLLENKERSDQNGLGRNKKLVKKLKSESLKEFDHDLNRTINAINDKYIEKFGDKGAIPKRRFFAGMQYSYFPGEAQVSDFDELLSDKYLSNVFVRARYEFLKLYAEVPNIEAIFDLLKSVRNVVPVVQYPSAMSICVGENKEGDFYFFPDENTKVYVFDDEKKLTRAYITKTYERFWAENYGDSNSHVGDQYMVFVPEYGIKKAEEILYGNHVSSSLAFGYVKALHVGKNRTAIAFEVDGKRKYYLCEGDTYLEMNSELCKEYENLIEEYEIRRGNGELLEDEKRVAEFYRREYAQRQARPPRPTNEEFEKKISDEKFVGALVDENGFCADFQPRLETQNEEDKGEV